MDIWHVVFAMGAAGGISATIAFFRETIYLRQQIAKLMGEPPPEPNAHRQPQPRGTSLAPVRGGI